MFSDRNCNKHLGIYFDSKLKLNEQTDYVIQKSYKKWSKLKYICNAANGLVFEKLCKIYILPVLENFNLIWFPNIT